MNIERISNIVAKHREGFPLTISEIDRLISMIDLMEFWLLGRGELKMFREHYVNIIDTSAE
jgi:hypothetical protein